MPAYVIATVSRAWDAQALAEYRRRNTDVVAEHGGSFLIRGGDQELLEGSREPLRVVVIEFPDSTAARAWYGSPAYAELRTLRQGASDTDVLLVEGV